MVPLEHFELIDYICPPSVYPRVITPPANSTTLNETATYTLTCVSNGYPSTQISWLHNGRLLSRSMYTNSPSGTDTDDEPRGTASTLTVPGVNFTEGGKYTCRSFSNRTTFLYGDSLPQTVDAPDANLVVQGKPDDNCLFVSCKH